MSDSSSQTQAIIDEYLGLMPLPYVVWAAKAIIFYDYCITLDQEITFFWRRKFNGAAILFYANRYFTLLYIGYQIPVALFATEKARTRKIFAMFDRRFTLLSVVSCNTFSNVSTGVGTFPTLVWSTFSGLRTFALSGNRMLGVLVFLLSIVPFAVNLSVYAYGVDGVYLPKLGCSIVNHIDQTVAKSAQDIGLTFAHLPLVTIASRTCLMGAEAVLIFLTWRTLQKKGKGLPHRDTLAGVLLRDGIIYFVVLFTLSSVHLTLTLLSIVSLSNKTSYATAFTDPLTSVLVTRFLLDLQASECKALHLCSRRSRGNGSLDNSEHECYDTLVFTDFLGSIRSTIVPADDDEEYENDQQMITTESGSTSGAG